MTNQPTKLMQTLQEKKIDELTTRLERPPTETELAIKETAETEAVNQIDATPSGCYVMEKIVEEHRKALAEALGTEPTEKQFKLFKDIYGEEITDENMNREMRM